MIKFPYQEESVYMDCDCNMSVKKLADVLYATVMTRSAITSTFSLAYEYDRKQNTYNEAFFKIYIRPSQIVKFEELSNLKLYKPEKVGVN
jgi:hypothetical protein